ncbi:hypothetical protein EJ02DRAFT_336403, partial [Clathrospora elynae]
PPTVACITRNPYLSIGKKVYIPHRVCTDCLQRHDPQQIRIWANNNTTSVSLIKEEIPQKQALKRSIEAQGRYLFEDPDYQYCRRRLLDLSLCGTQFDCTSAPTDSARLTIPSLQHIMLAPPRPHCAFGTACGSRPGGQEQGPDLCSWCKNMSFAALYRLSESQPDTQWLKRLADEYMHQLERDNFERITKGWSHLCACKDPDFRSQAWRRDFNPKDSRICGSVLYRGQLCTRCFQMAQEQGCPWLEEFDGDRLGFPCVFEDTRLRRLIDANWKVGPVDQQGHPDSGWEKDPRRHGRCERARFKNQLCQKCFSRMCEIRGFGRYFDTEWGKLRRGYGL